MTAQEADIDITRYTIISKIGEGSFSKVYRVKDLKTHKSYAAKVCRFMVDEDTKDSEETRLLFREVNLMSLLNHPSVLKFIGYYSVNFDEDPLPTIITELAMNGSLRDIIKMETQGLSPNEWNFTKKLINIYGIAVGMSYLHSHNVLHRDLKPENILIDEYLHPKISDFGLSKINDFLSASMNFQSQKGMKGTPAYMAPEIISEEKYSKSSDVYAFGFIVYEIMTCKEPFENYDIYKLMKKVVLEGYRPKINEDVPNSYKELIEKCWSQKPEERPTFDEIVSELKKNNEIIGDIVEAEYYDYADFIDNYRSTFDATKRMIHFSEFIEQQGKIIKPILIGANLSDEDETTKSSNESERKEERTRSNQISSKEKQQINNDDDDDNNNVSDNKPKKIIETEDTYKFYYPLIAFNQLSEKNQNLVEMAENDGEKSFLVGKFLIQGKNGFPNNIVLGMKYIEHSVNEKCVDSIVFYIELLIKGKTVSKDLMIANTYLTKLINMKDSRHFLLQGLMKYKMNKFKEAARFYSEGAQIGNAACMYKYGKMLFIGEGTEKNNNESIKQFTKSNELGYSKSGYFLTSLKSLNKIKQFSKLPSETQMVFILNNIKNKENEQKPEFDQILLSPKKTERVFFNKTLKSNNFYECLKHYQHINIELEYPSESFKSILDLVIKIRKKKQNQLNIGIVFSLKQHLTIEHRCFLKDISYHRIDTSIQSIPNRSFFDCSSMTQIIIPSSVTKINDYAFFNCSSLTQITIPSSVTQIGGGTFNECSKLQEITIEPGNATEYEFFERKFFLIKSNSESKIFDTIISFTPKVESAVVPPFIKIIGGSAFAFCSSLKQITIPSSVTSIGEYAFFECSSLTQITFAIPSSVTSIGNSAFSGCSLLTQITIPSSVTSIGNSAFSRCSSLTQITFAIPSSVTSIGNDAFTGCSSLTQITIPSSVTSIGNDAFSRCSSLTQITIPSSVTSIGESTFTGCSSLTQITIPYSVTSIGNYAFEGCSSLTQITIPSSVTSIGNYAFCKCSSLKNIEIPSSVTKIGDDVFTLCSSLKNIIIPFYLNTDKIGLKSRVKITKI